MKYIALHGAYYPNNFGDVLILAIQSKWIKDQGLGVVLPYAESVYREQIKPAKAKGINGLKISDKVIYGAGGYLGEPLDKKIKWGFQFFKKHVLPAEYAIFSRKKLAIIGTGIGPISNIITKFEIKRICKHAQIISARDENSKKWLISNGISEEKIFLTSDVALTLQHSDIPVESIENANNLLNKLTGIKYGIHLTVDINSDMYGEKMSLLVQDTIRFLNAHPEIDPVFIIDNNNSTQNNTIEFIRNQVNNKGVVYRHENIWETVALLSKMDLIISNKLHVGIVGYTLGIKCVSYPYHLKTLNFYKQIEEEELCIPLLELQQDIVYNMLTDTLTEEWKKKRVEKREKVFPILEERARKNKEILVEFIK